MSEVVNWPDDALKFDEAVIVEGEGHAWIQWKGTSVCMDVHCRCGADGHVDAEFAYFYRCRACGVTFAVGQNVRLYSVSAAHVEQVVGDRAVEATEEAS